MPEKKKMIARMELVLKALLLKLKPEAELTSKAMFGGAGFFVDSVIFAAWFGDGLAIKLPEGEREALLRVAGTKESQSKAYVEVPPLFLDEPALLEPWVERSVAYVHQPKPRKRK